MPVAFVCRTRSTMSPADLFNLSRNIDAHVGSMTKSRERAIAGTTTGLISEGEHVTWQAWHLGVRFRMTSRITHMEAPASFTDQQVRGPFKYLRHTHEFRPDGSGTLMVDTVEFAAPFGALGRLVEKLVLARYMENLIRERNEFLVAQALTTPDPGR
ncbi:SRPBCC family protein [Paenarthrobacter ureafaciens]|uniref:SRPBCC family protein n=1 Tax=Paenarthrobacter ureafaciens TaxID=37931 RepID=UPI001FB2E468|nr:SRPBCC family protein [Paenarthrobacter ureafaciens]UOD81548.1 SRPBCC family protein [Paenarthrobacter ureafaciens]WNZ04203.1 SRPBCC family protein [Paenarthrobacter ureafaciens]